MNALSKPMLDSASETSRAKNVTRSAPTITVRQPELDFDADIPRLWFRGNRFLTFLFNGFNLTFPEGERMFVRAVHAQLPNVKDPELLEQMRAFSAQEGQHAREHERLIAMLRRQGYDLDGFFEGFLSYTRFVNKRAPMLGRLAATAALEHYTSTLATHMLEYDLLDGVHPTMRKLLSWHAAEEIEHRAVAFDVLKAVRPSYALRVYGFVMGSISATYWIVRGMRLFQKQTGCTLREVLADLRALDRTSGHNVVLRVVRDLLGYLRPGFHPSQAGSIELAYRELRAAGLEP